MISISEEVKNTEDVKTILESIEELALNSSKIPIINKLLLDEERFFALLDILNKNLPEEITQSKEIVFSRDRILNDAKLREKELIETAEARASLMTSEHEVIKKASVTADAIIKQAEEKAITLTSGTQHDYDQVINKAKEQALEYSKKVKEDAQTSVSKAKEDADVLIKGAREQAEALRKTSQEKIAEIMKKAHAEAENVMKKAKEDYNKTLDDSDQYADYVLAELETSLESMVSAIKKGKEKILYVI